MTPSPTVCIDSWINCKSMIGFTLDPTPLSAARFKCDNKPYNSQKSEKHDLAEKR